MRADDQRFAAIQERDIDHLIVEELVVSAEFEEWITKQIVPRLIEIGTFINAWHSVYDSELGESDIEFGFTDTAGRNILILIENKITAKFQEEQLQRYQKRGEKALKKDWDEFHTCLFAPESYVKTTERADMVDSTLTYETVRDWFSARETRRAAYRSQVLTAAIRQGRRGYVSEPNKEATSFRQGYWQIAHTEFPKLEMDEPTGVAGGNSWERFNPSNSPSDIQLVHKMDRGVVDLTFGGRAAEETIFRNQYEPLLGPDMNIVETGKSLSVRISVMPLDWKGDPTEQSKTIREGLSAASRLHEWYRQTQSR